MFDTHAIAQSLTRADLTSAQADAITAAVISAREQNDHVTGDQFKAGLAELRSEMAGLDSQPLGIPFVFSFVTPPPRRASRSPPASTTNRGWTASVSR